MTSQLQVLNKILFTKDYSIIEKNNLTEDFFFNYRSEFNYIKNHYEKYGVVPDRLSFLNKFPEFDIIDVAEPDSYLLEQLYNDYNVSYMIQEYNGVKKLFEANRESEALEKFAHAADNLRSGGAATCTSLVKDKSRYDRYLERVQNHDKYYISTGFPELDNLIGGIDAENELMVIAARTGVGKSWTLLKMAAAGALQGKTVGIYSGEMSVDKVGYRIDTLIGNIDNNVITRGKDTSAQLKYKNYLDNIETICPGDIKVLTPNDIAGPATVDALRAFVDREHIDILLVDQYSLLEDTSHSKVMHERVANISKAMKNLQVMKRLPIISVSQLNRTTTEDKEQDTTQIGLSDRIGQDATTIIMLERQLKFEDEETKTKIKDDRLILNVVKSRDGGTGKIVYHANFNTGTFIPLDGKETDASHYETVEDVESDGNPSTRPF